MFLFFRAAPAAYESCYARGWIRAVAAGLHPATAMQDLSHICHLHCSSRQCLIFNPLSGPGTVPTSLWIRVRFSALLATMGTLRKVGVSLRLVEMENLKPYQWTFCSYFKIKVHLAPWMDHLILAEMVVSYIVYFRKYWFTEFYRSSKCWHNSCILYAHSYLSLLSKKSKYNLSPTLCPSLS